MTVIYRSDGIEFRMYFKMREHNPPHIHASYSGFESAFSIHSGKLIEGYVPRKIKHTIASFIIKYKKELLEMWATQNFYQIEKGEKNEK